MTRPILIIEDDADISESLKYNFEREGLPAIVATTGEAGLTAVLNEREPPSLIILDLMLPGMSGIELCRRLRREPATRRTPIIMLTAKASETDRVTGLDLGADDYITKPFSVRELLARVRAVMRRADETMGKTYEDDHLAIDFDDIRVLCDGAKIKLTNKEFTLLSVLARSTCTSVACARSSTSAAIASRLWSESVTGLWVAGDCCVQALANCST